LSVADPAVSAVNGKLGAFGGAIDDEGAFGVQVAGGAARRQILRLVERLEEGGNARVRRHGASSGNE
jgi:hypothetical protein